MVTSKKNSILLGALTILGLFLIAIAILASIKITPMAVYTDEEFGIQLKYPAHWNLVRRPDGGAIVAFIAPKATALDSFNENVNISFVNLAAQPMTLDRFTRQAMQQLTGTFGEYVKVLEAKATRMAGRPAYRFVYIGHLSPEQTRAFSEELGEEVSAENPLKYLHVWIVDGVRAFIFTYVGQNNDFDKFLSNVKTMIKSFQLL